MNIAQDLLERALASLIEAHTVKEHKQDDKKRADLILEIQQYLIEFL